MKEASEVPTSVPVGKVSLTLLLVNGQRKEGYLFNPKDTIRDVCQSIFNEWPSDWTSEKPQQLAQLKLLHRGRFLEENVSLEGHKIPTGENTVVHLLVKSTEALEQQSADKPKPNEELSDKCCCLIM